MGITFNSSVYAETNGEIPEDLQYNQNIFDTLSFQDLAVLSKGDEVDKALQAKIDYVLYNVAVDNTISKDSSIKNNNKVIGDFIRVASWNIERGMHLDDIIKVFNKPEILYKRIEKENPKMANRVKNQIRALRKADIITLTEVDVGMPRTNYRNIIEDFANAIGYNYAYSVEFLEVDPAHLGLEEFEWSEEAFLFPDGLDVDEEKYRGLHGSAILSRFPLKNVEVVRLPKKYDWFRSERIKINRLESIRRRGSAKLFGEIVLREIRYGERIAVVADVDVPGLDTPLTVISAHLENRTSAKNRKNQLDYLLERVKNKQNPLVIGGDFNTSIHDAAPVGTNKPNSKLNKFLNRLKVYNVPYKMVVTPAFVLPNTLRKSLDPSVRTIPVISVNPERQLFNLLKKFEFDDDTHFDFRSTPGKTVGSLGNLANSNERRLKGFVSTYQFERPLFVGRFKLDWLFVKGYCDKAIDNNCTYKMAPHFGMTMFDFNYQFDKPFADHAPVTVDLPLNDPGLLTKPEIKDLKKIIKEKKTKKDIDAVQRKKELKRQEKIEKKEAKSTENSKN